MKMKLVEPTVCVCLLVGLCVASALGQAKPAAKQPAAKRPAAPASRFNPKLLRPASLVEKAPEVYEVKFTTTKGDFVVQVTRAWAPLGADRFYNLVKNGFYEGAHFFRVLPGFVVQFGISAYPEVASVWGRAVIKDDPVKQSNKRGSVTFATAGANTRTTQVFISLADRNSFLDSQGFSPFGQVTLGMDVVEQLYSGYGEGAPQGNGPRQDLIEARGKAYLDKDFPELDSIKTATLVSSEAPKPAPAKP